MHPKDKKWGYDNVSEPVKHIQCGNLIKLYKKRVLASLKHIRYLFTIPAKCGNAEYSKTKLVVISSNKRNQDR